MGGGEGGVKSQCAPPHHLYTSLVYVFKCILYICVCKFSFIFVCVVNVWLLSIESEANILLHSY